MSSLTNDLQKIYLTKLQIKEIIGTDSDVFEDYPDLIETAIQEGGGEGLDWDDVAQAGYIVPAGTKNISSNGTVDVSAYVNAYVDVPAPALRTINITENGRYESGAMGVDGWNNIQVDVPQAAVAGKITITENGQHDVSTYQYAVVQVQTSGGYETHTVSDVTEFYNEDDTAPYMWGFVANEMDGETSDVSSLMYSKKYWGYCYPNEFEFEMNPVINFDDMGFGLNMTSYTDLVKREFTYNALPDFNTYKGYTYSYQYVNPEYDPELGNDQYLTYEYRYGEQLLYSTQLEIVQLSRRETVAPNQYMNGIWRVYDGDNPGLIGYYDETEMGEGNYQNRCWLSIGCLSPDETGNVTVTQFTSSYHGAASYTTGFDPYSLCGYTWNAVVNGHGWLIDLVSKDSELLATEMRLTEGMDASVIEQAAYLNSGNHEFTQEIELSDQSMVFDGYFVAAKIGDKYYEIGIPTFEPYGIYDENNAIPATGTYNDICQIGSPNLLVEMNDIENYYSTWSMTLTLHIPDNFYLSESCYWTWTFTGTPRN